MERKNISQSQKEKALTWKDGFYPNEDNENHYSYFRYENDAITMEEYCQFLGLDYKTVCLLGNITQDITYRKVETLYILRCEVYLDRFMNDKLSFELEDNEDFLGLFRREEETKIGVARWLPSNWKELITDEQKEEIIKEWREENSVTDLISDSEKEEIAYDYMSENSSECASHSFEIMGSYEQKDFIKECIDNL